MNEDMITKEILRQSSSSGTRELIALDNRIQKMSEDMIEGISNVTATVSKSNKELMAAHITVINEKINSIKDGVLLNNNIIRHIVSLMIIPPNDPVYPKAQADAYVAFTEFLKHE